MKVYHGTSDGFLDDNIIKEGIVSRSVSGNNNFCGANVSSHSEMVYLTSAENFAFIYGCISAVVNDHDKPTVLEISIDDLDRSKLRVDENLISLEETGGFITSLANRRKQVAKAFTDTRWEESLQKVNKCAYTERILKFRIGHTDKENPFMFPSVYLLDSKDKRSAAIKLLITQFTYLSDLNRIAKRDEKKKKWFILTDFVMKDIDDTEPTYSGYYHEP
jgi:hypothetical protein